MGSSSSRPRASPVSSVSSSSSSPSSPSSSSAIRADVAALLGREKVTAAQLDAALARAYPGGFGRKSRGVGGAPRTKADKVSRLLAWLEATDEGEAPASPARPASSSSSVGCWTFLCGSSSTSAAAAAAAADPSPFPASSSPPTTTHDPSTFYEETRARLQECCAWPRHTTLATALADA
jgi:hypothetical protein